MTKAFIPAFDIHLESHAIIDKNGRSWSLLLGFADGDPAPVLLDFAGLLVERTANGWRPCHDVCKFRRVG